ncbi:tetraacyldisaccharide 4'-kinase [Aureimonas endophytica]|uniref:Tetraacyldisaccharide 4'-kinase n=1 Tax=Aureimonas endophytica TaxID=2027858 RepID=A0A916ZJP6_9HYPH|nr:tetraacyldisaccharide 4'-kinase [Aureimonas endophytica]GGD99644.1 tetraacyldisaccharide 4'-kinase [Aureimonas endophytica]
MAGETPGFWWREAGWQAKLLGPAAALYGTVAARRLDRGERAETGLPVLCVGNFTIGGGGKTPTAIALAGAARAEGLVPGFVSRGHGGTAREAVLVDLHHHHAGLVGDEPMLLARHAPTAVAVDRKRAAALLAAQGVDFLIMDDGFQSARLAVDFALIVIDAGRGLGNARVLPAGPLRAPLGPQIRHADALLVIGKGSAGDGAIRRTAKGGKPVHEAVLRAETVEHLRGRRLFAFAGIADPGKFYRTIRELGLDLAGRRDFPDHHPFTLEDMADLREEAARAGARLVTTEKDAVRLEARGAEGRAFRAEIEVLGVALAFEPAGLGRRFVRETLAAFKRRRLR